MPRRLALVLSLFALVACQGDPHALEWGVRFDSAATRARAARVTVQILEGGCSGTEIYAAELSPGGGATASAPRELDKGLYGFAARARDADCVWFASACEARELPVADGERVIVTLAENESTAACPPAECTDGHCEGEPVDGGTTPDGGGTDGGPPPSDGGIVDGCMPTGAEVCNESDDDCDGRTDEGFDLTSDSMNCGTCGVSCGTGGSCSGGTCSCADGLTFDSGSGRCLDLQQDPENCGSVATSCSATEYCASGTCACALGLTSTSGSCLDRDTDPAHCGSSDADCSSMGTMVTCRAGACEDACTPGQTNCSNACVDTDVHPLNCGSCGNVCESRQLCVEGRCEEYDVGAGCTSCPCDACEPADTCCEYGSSVLCFEAGSCPAFM